MAVSHHSVESYQVIQPRLIDCAVENSCHTQTYLINRKCTPGEKCALAWTEGRFTVNCLEHPPELDILYYRRIHTNLPYLYKKAASLKTDD